MLENTDGVMKKDNPEKMVNKGTQDTGQRQTRQITQHYMCRTQPYTRHRTTTNKTNNTTLYVLDTTIHKTQDNDKQDK